MVVFHIANKEKSLCDFLSLQLIWVLGIKETNWIIENLKINTFTHLSLRFIEFLVSSGYNYLWKYVHGRAFLWKFNFFIIMFKEKFLLLNSENTKESKTIL